MLYGKKQDGFLGFFRKLDMYPRIDKDATQASWYGTVLSFIGIGLSIYLFLGQWEAFNATERTSEFFVLGTNRSMHWENRGLHARDTSLFVNFNITFTQMPCNYLTVDYFDVFGIRDLDAVDHIKLNSFKAGSKTNAEDVLVSSGPGRKLLSLAEADNILPPSTASHDDLPAKRRHGRHLLADMDSPPAPDAGSGDVIAKESHKALIDKLNQQLKDNEAEGLKSDEAQKKKLADMPEGSPEYANHKGLMERAVKTREAARKSILERIATEERLRVEDLAQAAISPEKKGLTDPGIHRIRERESDPEHLKKANAAVNRAHARLHRQQEKEKEEQIRKMREAAAKGDSSIHEKHTGIKQPEKKKAYTPTPTPQPKKKDPKDPFELIPDDVPTLFLKDLERLILNGAENSDLHPTAVKITIGGTDRHIIPGVGEHQVIDADHPILKDVRGKSKILNPPNFKKYLKAHEIVLVNFFAPWCHWCRRFEPVWEATAQTLRASSKEYKADVALGKVDCNSFANQDLCREQQVRAFPTVKVYRHGNSITHKLYNGDRTVSALVEYIKALPTEADPLTQYGPETVELQASDTCVAWRQTGDCDPEKGEREAEQDKGCKTKIANGASGYCECKGPDGAEVHASHVACDHSPFKCNDECDKKLRELKKVHPEAPGGTQENAEKVKARKGQDVGMNSLIKNIGKKMHAKMFKKEHAGDTQMKEPEQKMGIGCKVHGSFKVGLIPGSLVFTAYSPWHNFNKEVVDMSHHVDHLTFGFFNKAFRDRMAGDIKERLAEDGISLDTLSERSYGNSEGHKFSHEHFLRLLQTDIQSSVMADGGLFSRDPGGFVQTFQYSANSHQFEINTNDDEELNDELPSVRFVWDMDPMGVEIAEKTRTAYSFLVSILAIVGGIFWSFGMADGIVYSIASRLVAKKPDAYLSST